MMPAEVVETESGDGEHRRYREHEHQTHASSQDIRFIPTPNQARLACNPFPRGVNQLDLKIIIIFAPQPLPRPR
jgi:hypothetical protein